MEDVSMLTLKVSFCACLFFCLNVANIFDVFRILRSIKPSKIEDSIK